MAPHNLYRLLDEDLLADSLSYLLSMLKYVEGEITVESVNDARMIASFLEKENNRAAIFQQELIWQQSIARLIAGDTTE